MRSARRLTGRWACAYGVPASPTPEALAWRRRGTRRLPARWALLWARTRGRVESTPDVVHQRWPATSLQARLTQTWDACSSLNTLSTGDTVTIGKRDLLASLGVARDWRRWRAFASARVEGLYEHTAYTIDSSRVAGLQLAKDHDDFVGVAATLSAQALSYPALAISPENGVAVGVRYQHDWEMTGPAPGQTTGRGWWNEWRGRLRHRKSRASPGP